MKSCRIRTAGRTASSSGIVVMNLRLGIAPGRTCARSGRFTLKRGTAISRVAVDATPYPRRRDVVRPPRFPIPSLTSWIRVRCTLLAPLRGAASTCDRRSYVRWLSAEQPILPAIEAMSTRSELSAFQCSDCRWGTRSRASEGNCLRSAMTSCCHEVGPLQSRDGSVAIRSTDFQPLPVFPIQASLPHQDAVQDRTGCFAQTQKAPGAT